MNLKIALKNEHIMRRVNRKNNIESFIIYLKIINTLTNK